MLTIGSLCTGIAGLDLGLEQAGLGPVLWQVENDDFCVRVLEARYPGVLRLRDLREVDADKLPHVDCICAGFACQPSSVAGRRAGRSDERWLWPDVARIIRGVRPRYVVLENVPGLLTVDRGLGFRDVLRDLAACGFDACWFDLRAADVGAPHRRERVFVVAWRVPDTHRDGLRHFAERGAGAAQPAHGGHSVAFDVGQIVADSTRQRGDPDVSRREERPDGQRRSIAARAKLASPERAGEPVADPGGSGLGEREGVRSWQPFADDPGPRVADAEHLGLAECEAPRLHAGRPRGLDADGRGALARWPWPPGPDDAEGWARWIAAGGPEPCVRRDADGVAALLDRVARLKALGNAVVPDDAEVAGRVILKLDAYFR